MSEEASKIPGSTEKSALHGAVLVGVIPGQPARVVHEAARYSQVLGAPLLVVHVDVTRFVTSEDPDGYVHSAPIDLNIATSEGELDEVRAEVEAALSDTDVPWVLDQLVGDPALAIKHHADKVDARLLVIGTRKRGFGESVREFFTGSVAARLAHRQHRPILVVPLDDPLSDEDDPWVGTEA
ncbi:nucleotide-binding universal stress UspA family protein [Microbacterium endophyticum]|uniref:Nucleotide-binding universal stress UspA family protein n=1 Tax=Microbacterium endophyticum TaxID=1526412 RepID=A0A7W4V580_9MICO|nr:universal stress protein [Microbacterium endophyticum]MBB2977087.1 nucleotide-binding universal stress UspA family protein [Microbacterium endophyticum]NIK36119.1 nucleotide-binding universal stress UspA family protein [Microbacterium endophyticum]